MELKLSSHTYTKITSLVELDSTLISVESIINFPNINPLNDDYFYLDIMDQTIKNYETVKVINIDELDLTVVRAQGGTIARIFPIGSHCGLRINKAVIDDLITRFDTYKHTQMIAISIWEINHNLSKFPSVTVVDSAGSVVIGNINYIDKNNLSIEFEASFAGIAYLN
jgi:hypothetical protein